MTLQYDQTLIYGVNPGNPVGRLTNAISANGYAGLVPQVPRSVSELTWVDPKFAFGFHPGWRPEISGPGCSEHIEWGANLGHQANSPDQDPRNGWKQTVRKSADNIDKQSDRIANKTLSNAGHYVADLLRGLVN